MIKEYRQAAGLTQKQFSDLFNPPIPIDTIKNWDCGRKQPPDWVEGLIIEKLKKMEVKKVKEYSEHYKMACEDIGANGYKILEREKYHRLICKTIITKFANGFGEIEWVDSEDRIIAVHIGTLDDYPRIGEVIESMKEQ